MRAWQSGTVRLRRIIHHIRDLVKAWFLRLRDEFGHWSRGHSDLGKGGVASELNRPGAAGG